MPVKLKGVTFYRTTEALARAGISRATFYRWLAAGRIADTANRDRNGQRIFTKHEIDQLADIAMDIRSQPQQITLPIRQHG